MGQQYALRDAARDGSIAPKPPMSGKGVDIEHWSRITAEWTAWARAPNHDAFWAYRASLLAFIGQGAGEALDVGCGEGRVSRLLKECGYRVTAVDPVASSYQ